VESRRSGAKIKDLRIGTAQRILGKMRQPATTTLLPTKSSDRHSWQSDSERQVVSTPGPTSI
jgi:hypothetical protein